MAKHTAAVLSETRQCFGLCSPAMTNYGGQEQRRQTQRGYYSYRKGCGQFIYFDESQRTENGKWIPLEKETGEPHQCQQQ
jgi:hypothetical protein